jgi:glycosyltransferase involved in cell wall biosynthesis
LNNILVVGPSTKGLKGGQATHMENIDRAFGLSEKVNLTYFYSSSGLENTENGIKKVLRLVKTIASFPLSLKSKEVVHLNSSFDNKAIIRDLCLLIWCLVFRKKIVVQYHGGNPFSVSWLKSSIFKKLYSSIWQRSSILVLNADQEKWFAQFEKIRSTTVKNYVSLPNLSITKSDEKYRFVYLGRIIKEKGLIDIVDSVKTIQNEFDFEVDIYGQGEDIELISDYIEKNELSDIVKLKGSVEVDEKLEVLKNSHFFLYPSYYPEGLPYAVLEALSFAMPVICTNAGALEHVVTHLDTCLKVKEKSPSHLAELMATLMSDKALQNKLSQNSRKMIEQEYSVDVMKSVFLELWCA